VRTDLRCRGADRARGSSPPLRGASGLGWRDAAVLLAFGVFAFAFQMGRWNGLHPFVFLYEDAANIASFAAAIDHPERFVTDPFLGDSSNFAFYATLHVPLLRALNSLTADYGTAFISLLGVHVFLQACGFYVLGRVLFRNRYWALLFALITLPTVSINLAEYWGVFWDPQPRFTYQAVLPFLLAATLAWRGQPRRWPWLMLAAGAMFYVHPVSAPGWAFAIWLSLWVCCPVSWSTARRVVVMAALGLLFLALAAPFATNYLAPQIGNTSERVAWAELQGAMEATFQAESLDAAMAVRNFLLCWHGTALFFWMLAGIGALVLFRLRDRHRGALAMLGLWVVGLLAVSIGVPLLDQAVARMRGSAPFEIDLIRSIRYLVPLMLLFVIWPVSALHDRVEKRAGRLAMAAAGLALTAVWIEQYPPKYVGAAFTCWSRGQLACASPAQRSVLEGFEHVRAETPPDARLFATSYQLALRYATLRPVVYSSAAPYANRHPARFLQWQEDGRRIQAAQQLPEPRERLAALLQIARALGANFALIDSRFIPPGLSPEETLVWRNRAFALLQLAPRAAAADATPREEGPRETHSGP